MGWGRSLPGAGVGNAGSGHGFIGRGGVVESTGGAVKTFSKLGGVGHLEGGVIIMSWGEFMLGAWGNNPAGVGWKYNAGWGGTMQGWGG